MLKKLKIYFIVLTLLCCFSAKAEAANIDAAVTVTDGTAPFDADNTPGNDANNNNGVVRTNDSIRYSFSVAIEGVVGEIAENVTITANGTQGIDFDLPATCLTTGVTPVSSITGDPNTVGETIVCNVGNISAGNLLEFNIDGSVAHNLRNGDVIGFNAATIAADGLQTQFFGTTTALVSARPHYDIAMNTAYGHRNGGYSLFGPSGEVGTVLTFPIVIKGDEDPRGDEILTNMTGTIDLSSISPNARLYEGWAGSLASACGFQYEAGFLRTWRAPRGGLSTALGGPGGAGTGDARNSVADTGDIVCSETGPGGTLTINISGTDFKPREMGLTRVLPDLDAINRDLNTTSHAGAHYGSAAVAIFIPVSDIIAGGATSLPYSATFEHNSTSVGNNTNQDPNTSNEVLSSRVYAISSWRRLVYAQDISTGISYPALDGTTSIYINDGKIGKDQVWRSVFFYDNASLATDFEDTTICQIWDNTTHQITDTGLRGVYAELYQRSTPNIPWQPFVLEYGVQPSFDPRATCTDADATWYADPTLAPGGIAAINTVRAVGTVPYALTGSGSRPRAELNVYHKPVAGLPSGTTFVNYGAIQNENLWSNTTTYPDNWYYSRYNPDTNGGAYGTDAILALVDVDIEKREINDAITVVANKTATYELDWEVSIPGGSSTSTTTAVTITDTIPQYFSYVAGSSNFDPIAVNANADGSTDIVWSFPNAVVNATQTKITYDILVNLNAPDSTIVTNTVVISSPDDDDPVDLRSDSYDIRILNPNLLSVTNTPVPELVKKDGLVSFVITYENIDQTDRPNADIINILPHPDANTSPASSYNGTLELIDVQLTGALRTGTEQIFYTKEPTININRLGDDPSNQPGGSTVWCIGFTGGTCPSSAAEVTAVRITSETVLGQTGPYEATINMQANGFAIGDRYVNEFITQADDLSVSLESGEATAIVGEADLSITKVVTTEPDNIGDTIVYLLTVTNDGPHDVGSVQVTDILPTELTYSGDNSGGNYDSVTGIWNVGTIVAGTSASIEIEAETTIFSELINKAEITQTDFLDPDSDTDSSFDEDDFDDAIEDDDEVETRFNLLPIMSSTKAISLQDNGDGTFEATVEIVVKNEQGTTLFDLTVVDNLANSFGVLNNDANLQAGEYEIVETPANAGNLVMSGAGDNATGSSSFTGVAPNENLLQYNSGDKISVGETATIIFKVRFVPDFSASSVVQYSNQATSTADITEDFNPKSSAFDEDLSDDVTDPTSDDDPTIFKDDIITLVSNDTLFTKTFNNVIDNGDGTYDITFIIDATNEGSVPLYDLQIDELLEGAQSFGTYQVSPTSLGEYTITSVNASISTDVFPSGDSVITAVNTAFTGQLGNENLLLYTAGDNLGVGDTLRAQLTIKFLPDVSISGPAYLNTAVFIADPEEDGQEGNSANPVNNLSDDPNNPADLDSDGDGDPDDPNNIRSALPFESDIEFTKQASAVTDNGDGTFDVTFNIAAKNTKSSTLYDVQIFDNLTSIFGKYEGAIADVNEPGEYTVTGQSFNFTDNAPIGNFLTDNVVNYTGQAGSDTFLLPNAGASIGFDDVISVNFTLRFYPNLQATSQFLNQAKFFGDVSEDALIGNDPIGIKDDSDDPTNPTNVDGDPDDVSDDDGNPDDATVIVLPLTADIGIAEQAVVSGNSVDLIFTLQNNSNFQLTNLSLPLDLDLVFGASNYTVDNITSSDSLHDSAFTGESTNTNIASSGYSLAVGDTQTITVSITIDNVVDMGLGFGNYESQVTGSAGSPNGSSTDTDISHNGTNPDPENDGADDNSTPTPIQIGSIELNKTVGFVRSTGVEDQYDVELIFDVVNNGAKTLTDIILTDDFITQNPASISFDNVISGNITAQENSTATSFTAAFNNNFITNGLANGFTGTGANLDSGESAQLRVVIRFTVNRDAIQSSPIFNSAVVQGTDIDNNVITDVSDNNTPDDGSFDDPTPIEILPTGLVYWSRTGQPIEGAILQILDGSGNLLPSQCLVTGQQEQTTTANGEYRLDFLFGADAACPSNSATSYSIRVLPPTGFGSPSLVTPPTGSSYNLTGCLAPGVASGLNCKIGDDLLNVGYVDINADKDYFLAFVIDPSAPQGDFQVVNNHIALDTAGDAKITLIKRASKKTTSVGDILTWQIDVINNEIFASPIVNVVDYLPTGFTYVAGSASLDGTAITETINGNQVSWNIDVVNSKQTVTVKFATRVNVGAKIGKSTNTARAFAEGQLVSNTATATVEVTEEPVFDCSDILGKVFYDKNLNGHQDNEEEGIAGAVIFSLDGLKITTDKFGRYHIPCADIPHAKRGSNFALKLDTRSLPTGYRVITENPRVIKITRGKIGKINFGVSLARVVAITINDQVFETCSTKLTANSYDYLIKLMKQLEKEESILKISFYTSNITYSSIRLEYLIKEINKIWKRSFSSPYKLNIEDQILSDNKGSKEVCK